MSSVRITGRSAAAIATSVRDHIDRGALPAGAVLPTVRALAQQLGVNRNTVAAAYSSLAAAGAVDTRGRAGTIVRERSAAAGEGMSAQRGLVNLASGNPDRSLLPDVPTRLMYRPPLYGETTADPRLLAWAAESVAGDLQPGSSVTVTAGAIDAIERLLTAHLLRGDAVALEDPCFLSSVGVLRANGFVAIPMTMDSEGVTPDGLAAALEAGARAVVLTPRAHNPTGASITPRRAAALRQVLADSPSVLVIEDDHFSAVATTPYARSTPETSSRWALVRTMSKFLGPDLRVALVNCDVDTKNRLEARLGRAVWVSTLLQGIVGSILTDPSTGPRLIDARDRYDERRRTLVDTLTAFGLRSAPTADGLNVWIPLQVEEAFAVAALQERGWLVRAGADFAVAPRPHPAIRITTATMTVAQARALATDLAALTA